MNAPTHTPTRPMSQPRLDAGGPEFARTRVEMNALESIIQLRRHHPRRIKRMTPSHQWDLASPYGLQPEPEERS